MSQIKLWGMKEVFEAINSKFVIKIFLSVEGLPSPSTPVLKLTYINKIFKVVIKVKKLIQTTQKNWIKTRIQRNSFE